MIFSLYYFPPTAFWSLWKNSQASIFIESKEHYQKGSYRNRTHIASPQGFLPLGIPLLKGKNNQKDITEVLIDNSQPWQRDHWRALTTAYGKSPFFEHYAEELWPIFQEQEEYLFSFNLKALELVKRLLFFDRQEYLLTQKYEKWEENEDFREKIKPNRDFNHKFVQYVQVFSDRNGFVPNLSILDLLFCMGPESQRYL